MTIVIGCRSARADRMETRTGSCCERTLPRRHFAAILWVAATLMASSASANAKASVVQRAVAHCPGSVRAAFGPSTDPDLRVEVLKRGSWLVQRVVDYGSGTEGASFTKDTLVNPKTCEVQRLTCSYEDSSSYFATCGGEDDGDTGDKTRPIEELIAISDRRGPVERYNPARPEHALAKMLDDMRQAHGVDLVELSACVPATVGSALPQVSLPIAPPQPSFQGRPGILSRVLFPDGTYYETSRHLRRTQRVGQFDVYEVHLPSRYDGVAVAVHDRVADRHRWVFASRWCVLGRPRWIGHGGNLLIGYAKPRHPAYPGAMVVLDLTRSEARGIALVDDPEQVPSAPSCKVRNSRGCSGCLRFGRAGRTIRAESFVDGRKRSVLGSITFEGLRRILDGLALPR